MWPLEFSYNCKSLEVSKIAYDLAKIYAKSKLEQKLQKDYDFDKGVAPAEVEELEYLQEQFFFALDYLSHVNPGDLEHRLSNR